METLPKRKWIFFALGVLSLLFCGAAAAAWLKGWINQKALAVAYALSFPLTIPMAFAERRLLGWFIVVLCLCLASVAVFGLISNWDMRQP